MKRAKTVTPGELGEQEDFEGGATAPHDVTVLIHELGRSRPR